MNTQNNKNVVYSTRTSDKKTQITTVSARANEKTTVEISKASRNNP
ncbi:hypothetical protein [Flavobacterium ginsengiterrae]